MKELITWADVWWVVGLILSLLSVVLLWPPVGKISKALKEDLEGQDNERTL